MWQRLAYGRQGLQVQLPDDATVVAPSRQSAHPAPLAAVRHALAHPCGQPPLGALLQPQSKVTVVHCDGTRPMPAPLILEALAELFAQAQLPDENVTLLNALGSHRENTPAELQAIVGEKALARFQSVQSVATDRESMRLVGHLHTGVPVELHRAYVEADIRILLGFIEPHFFAGFSGGPKAVVPGVASLPTIMGVHAAALVGHPDATWGVLDGNPLWMALREAAGLAPPTTIVNVALNRDKELTAVWAGELDSAHRQGVAYVKEHAMQSVREPFDIVVTTNSGFPLDQNLYQTVKGMSAAARVVRSGGAIVVAAECSDGIPAHGAFFEIVQAGGTPAGVQAVVEAAGYQRIDQWQAQVLAMICRRARVFLYSAGITPEQARAMMLTPIADVSATVASLAAQVAAETGRPARIGVLPEGPQTLPYLVTSGG